VFEKLGKNPEFQKVYRFGKSKANKYLVMYVLTGESGPNRYGFSVSKKVGNSVVRHRITRLLRESVRKNDALVSTGNHIVIVARRDVKDKNFDDVNGAVFHLLKLHKLLKDVMD
jgi:ribonuclease P protein component